MRYNIQLPYNKSLRIREIVSEFVSQGRLPSVSDGDCHDVEIVCRALQTLTMGKPLVHPVVVDVEDCGAAYRFLMPLLVAMPGRWLLTGTPRLLQRPIQPLVDVLRGIGADIERVEVGWLIKGKNDTNTDNELALTIDATQSSQLASALVLAAPLLGLKTLCLATTDIPSLPYLQMTLACTRDWPVTIPGLEVPEIPIGAPGDWSAALFWFAYARLHPETEVSLSPLSINSVQGDSIITQWFKMLNMSISGTDKIICRDTKYSLSTPSCIEIAAKPLEKTPCLVLDVRDNLDTVPVMAVLAALLPADITFLNVHNLRLKESDRLQAIVSQLQPFADIELKGEELHIVGKGCPADARPVFDTHHDHRLAMAFLLFGPKASLNDTDCLRKSYPGLLKDLSHLSPRID